MSFWIPALTRTILWSRRVVWGADRRVLGMNTTPYQAGKSK